MRLCVCASVRLLLASSLVAQVPRGVSPNLARAVGRADTTVLLWVIARPGTDLDRLAADVAARGATVRRVSHFVGAVSASASGAGIADLASLHGVRRVQPLRTFVGRTPISPISPISPRPLLSAPADTTYGPNFWAIRQLHVEELHARGIRGAGVRIAMLDAGFNTNHVLMRHATVVAQYDFVYNDSVVRDQPGETQGEMEHGTGTWSLIAGDSVGVFVGVAPEAEFLLAKTEYTQSETRVEEDNWVAGIEWAVGLGAQVVSSSLGYLTLDNGFSYSPGQLSGDVDVTTVAADSAARRGILVVVSAGNDGARGATSIGTPADGDSVVAVGAVDSLDRVLGFSSRGPTADGRIKPEVVAAGFGLAVASGAGGIATFAAGTSYAAPLVAGLAALVQSGRGPAPAVELRRGLLQASNAFTAPDNAHGYGIPDALKLYAFPTGVSPLLPVPGTVGTLTPTFSWDAGTTPAAAGPNVYRLRLWGDSLQHLVLFDTVVATSSLTLPVPLPPRRVVWWSVVATSGLGVAESTAVVGPVIAQEWVSLVTLASPAGASIRDSMPTFVWRSPAVSAPPGPFTYDVAVYPASRDPSFAVAGASGITDTTFQSSQPLERNLPFRWRVVAHISGDSEIVTSPGTFLVLDESVPLATVLFQNFPNPFPSTATGVATTCIWFDVAQPGEVRLEIFDLRGRLVRRMVPAPNAPSPMVAGRYGRPAAAAAGTCDGRFAWDGRDDAGDYVRPGVYVVRLLAPGFADSRRVVFEGAP